MFPFIFKKKFFVCSVSLCESRAGLAAGIRFRDLGIGKLGNWRIQQLVSAKSAKSVDGQPVT